MTDRQVARARKQLRLNATESLDYWKVSSAWRRAVRHVHPDKSDTREDIEKFRVLTAHRDLLLGLIPRHVDGSIQTQCNREAEILEERSFQGIRSALFLKESFNQFVHVLKQTKDQWRTVVRRASPSFLDAFVAQVRDQNRPTEGVLEVRQKREQTSLGMWKGSLLIKTKMLCGLEVRFHAISVEMMTYMDPLLALLAGCAKRTRTEDMPRFMILLQTSIRDLQKKEFDGFPVHISYKASRWKFGKLFWSPEVNDLEVAFEFLQELQSASTQTQLAGLADSQRQRLKSRALRIKTEEIQAYCQKVAQCRRKMEIWPMGVIPRRIRTKTVVPFPLVTRFRLTGKRKRSDYTVPHQSRVQPVPLQVAAVPGLRDIAREVVGMLWVPPPLTQPELEFWTEFRRSFGNIVSVRAPTLSEHDRECLYNAILRDRGLVRWRVASSLVARRQGHSRRACHVASSSSHR